MHEQSIATGSQTSSRKSAGRAMSPMTEYFACYGGRSVRVTYLLRLCHMFCDDLHKKTVANCNSLQSDFLDRR